MSRSSTSTIDNAIGNQPSYRLGAYLEVYPTRIYFGSVERDNAFAGADGIPAGDDPVRQEIAYNSTSGLVTFFCDTALKYALDGDSSPVTTSYSSAKKPGVFGNKLFLIEGASVKRYSVNWSTVASKGSNPLSLDATMTPTYTPVAVHGISETECMVVCDNDGGFTVSYFNGTTEYISSSRFMFPSSVEWDGSTRTMEGMGMFSAGAKLGNNSYVYISNAATGVVEGMYYDPDVGTWSDIFIAMPTDLEVSLCEFRISNSFTRNNKIYLVGQFIRTDVYESGVPYTLILASEDGKTFSIDRFTLVSDIGYRFLATVGSNNVLYIGSCNRVCDAPSTWLFDGDDFSTSPKLTLLMDDIVSVSANDNGTLSVELKSGDEVYIDHAYITEDSLVRYYTGYQTSVGLEYVLYGTYLVDSIDHIFENGVRGLTLACTNISQYKLTDLSMPFYAEILGLSSIYDPMTEQSGQLYAATGGVRTRTNFFVDLWDHVGYANAANGITGINMVDSGGVSSYNQTGSHKNGIIHKKELSTILKSSTNPVITGTPLTVKIYGWAKPDSGGNSNDTVNLVMVTTDEDGNDEQTTITTDTKRWKVTYPTAVAGNDPITLSVTATEGRLIKKVGLVFENTVTCEVCPGRIEFTDNVEVPVSLALSNTPWERDADGTFSIPSVGQPFIMFAQRPYNAFNFVLTAMFENSVTGGIAGYPVGTGLLGLAEDAKNYVIARYDKVTQNVQLVKVRNGIETELSSAAPGWTLGDLNGMQFIHKDGHFIVSMYRESTTQFEIVLEYDWAAADGFMYTSKIATKKCGIYGAIMAPYVQTFGYSGGAQDDASSSDGIAIGPLEDVTDFPASGELLIDDNVYSYQAKIAAPAYIVGPHQLRQFGVYAPPFGNGKAGVECRYFDWSAPLGWYTGKLIAYDSGLSFINAGSLFQIYITTGGSKVWLRNRSRHYSDNSSIRVSAGALSTRVWPGVGGFSGISLKTGTYKKHSYGTYAMLNLSGEIRCYWFAGAGGQADTTIRDLIDTTTKLCGASAKFPGDYVVSSLGVSGETSVYQDDYADGFDLKFELDSPQTFEVRTNVKIDATNYENAASFEDDTNTNLVVTNLGGGSYSVAVVSQPSGTEIHKFLYTSGTSAQKIRVLFHKSNISYYQNNRWIWSMSFDELIYTQTNYVDIKLYTSGSVTFNNLLISDLHDWREAIYIDLETDGFSALSSIIQERPVEIEPESDGSLRFYYERERDTVIFPIAPEAHTRRLQMPADAASDAIVYGASDVVTVQNKSFSQALGFSTRLMRVPNLDTGAVEATQRTMEKVYQRRIMHDLKIRPDFRIELGDILDIAYVASGTDRVESFSIIVETCDHSFQQSDDSVSASMSVTGREYE